jgi:hypothetical protein
MHKRKRKTSITPEVGILEIVQGLLIILKTLKVVSWSWWVVLIPLWILIGLTGLIMLLMFIETRYNK